MQVEIFWMEWIISMINFKNDATLDNFNFHKWRVYDTCFPGKKTHWKLISIHNKLNFPYQKTSIQKSLDKLIPAT